MSTEQAIDPADLEPAAVERVLAAFLTERLAFIGSGSGRSTCSYDGTAASTCSDEAARSSAPARPYALNSSCGPGPELFDRKRPEVADVSERLSRGLRGEVKVSEGAAYCVSEGAAYCPTTFTSTGLQGWMKGVPAS